MVVKDGHLLGTERYIDRGDPAAADFVIGDLTIDGAWHDLSLAAIVPADAAGHLVHIRLNIRGTQAGRRFSMREKGNANEYNITTLRTQVASVEIPGDYWVMMDSARAIQYYSQTNIDVVSIAVAGWMTEG